MQQTSDCRKSPLPLPLGEVARVSGSERVLNFHKKQNIEYLLS